MSETLKVTVDGTTLTVSNSVLPMYLVADTASIEFVIHTLHRELLATGGDPKPDTLKDVEDDVVVAADSDDDDPETQAVLAEIEQLKQCKEHQLLRCSIEHNLYTLVLV